MEFSSCTRCLGWQAHSYMVSCQWRVPVLQLYWVPFNCAPCARWRKLQVYVGTSWSPRSRFCCPAVEWVDISRHSHNQLHRYPTTETSAGWRSAHTVFHNRGQRICSQRVDDEAVCCSTSGTGRAVLQLSLFSHQTMRWECLWHTGQSLGLPTHNPSTRAVECRNYGECVYYTS